MATTYSYTGSTQTWSVPRDGTIIAELWGGQGADGAASGGAAQALGGKGGYVKVQFDVLAGDTLRLSVAGEGITSTQGPSSSVVNGGWPHQTSAPAQGQARLGGGAGGGQSTLERQIGGGGFTAYAVAAGGGGAGSRNGSPVGASRPDGGDGGITPTDGVGYSGSVAPWTTTGGPGLTSGVGGDYRAVPGTGEAPTSGGGSQSSGYSNVAGGGGGGQGQQIPSLSGHFSGGGGGTPASAAGTTDVQGGGGAGGWSGYNASSGVVLLDDATGARSGDGLIVIQFQGDGGGAYQFRRGRRTHIAGARGVSIQGR